VKPATLVLASLVIALASIGCRGAARGRASPSPTSPSTAQTSGCGTAHGTGSSVEKMRSGGIDRSYRLYVPRTYDQARPAPVVLNFHGFGSNAREQEGYSRISAQSEAAGFIAVTPDGTGNPQRWYIYGRSEPGYVDDFAFVRELLDHLSAPLCLDQSRVYAMGISNGAGMSSLLGCELNDRIAAIAPVAGSPYSDVLCRGKRPMPVIAFHGSDDQLVPFEGGVGGRLGLAVKGVRQNMKDWSGHNGCTAALNTERVAADILRESYSACKDGANVVLYVVEDGGHTWPGAAVDAALLGKTTHSIDATALAWQFFAEHARK